MQAGSPGLAPFSQLLLDGQRAVANKSSFLLKPNSDLLVFWLPRQAVRAPIRGPAETGAGGVRGLLVSILLNGGFGYEDYLRLCSPLAVDHRI